MKDQVIDKITGDSPEAKSLDITQQNIEQLKRLFPDVFSENKIDFEALKAALGEEVDDSEERYNFTWKGKNKARQIAQTPSTGTLRPSKEESVNWDTTENLFIEGDNLEVLKLLQKSYHKKVKMIYIDPPYNTGKDFVYKDNFKSNIKNYKELTGQLDSSGNVISTNSDTSGRYHTDWLNMIYPRLKLARNLLSEDGVIFISIDDHEVNNLAKICNEIFGEENVLGYFPTIMNLKGNQDAFGFAETHEYLLVCTKSKTNCEINKFPIDEEVIFKEWMEDDYGLYKEADNLRATGVNAPREKRPNLWYPIFLDEETLDFYITGDNQPLRPTDTKILPINPNGDELSWYWGRSTFNENKHNLILKKTTNNWQFYKKQRPQIGDLPTKKAKSFFYKSDYSTSTATTRLKALMGGNKVFDGPKPVPLISDLLTLGTNEGSLVLDFFAGSATTAHAIFEQNVKYNKNLKFILVQLPEELDKSSQGYKSGYRTIADISRDRIIRAGREALDLGHSDIDIGFKAFLLDETNIRPWDADFDNLESVLRQATESIKENRSNEDVLYEIFLKYGYDLTTPVETETVNGKEVFVVGAGALIVCLDDEITSEVVEGIAKLKDELDPETTQVVFKDAGFADSNVKTNAIQILKQAGIDDVKSI